MIWVSYLLIFIFLQLVSPCPSRCECQKTYVDCSGRGLNEIPFGVPNDTTSLFLKQNHISRISVERLEHLTSLETLIISGNRIKDIPEDLFDRVPSLLRLSLVRNRLTVVRPLANRIHRLVSLDLGKNQITRVEQAAFTNFPNLVQINLSNNRLQYLHSDVFQNNQKLHIVMLHSNMWNCDCRISVVVANLNMSQIEIVECYNPPELRGEAVSKLTDSIPACLTANVVDMGREKQLVCPQKGDVTWIYNGIELDLSSAPIYRLSGQDMMIPSSVEYEHNFTCSVEHRLDKFEQPTKKYRQDRSRRTHRQAVHGKPPVFTFTPIDSSYREGSVVKLHCEVMGQPKPVITWYHNGQVLSNTRKTEFSFAGSVLRIYPFLEADVGSYQCAASNRHGRVEHTANIQLIASVPPSIVDGPSAQTVEVGEQVTFRCRAVGVPKPDVTWSYDGSVIPHIRGRMQVSSDGTELTIEKVGRSDEGVYSCMAGNGVGAMVADARLTVKGDYADKVDSLLDTVTLQDIAHRARLNVDRAVEGTQKTQKSVTNPHDLKRLFRFSIPAQAVELSKAREIYEESIRLVHEHVQQGLRLPVNQLAPNVSYEAVLAISHIQTLMGLSGCQTGQLYKDSCTDQCFHSKYRSYDGQCNNLQNPMWGVSNMPLFRLLPPVYENGFNTPVGWEKNRLYHGFPKPNPREISRLLVATQTITQHEELSAMVMQWGQFIDHDLTHTAQALSRRAYASGTICNRTCDNLDPCFNIPIAANDPKLHTGIDIKFPCIEFERSAAVCGSGETSLIFQRVTYRDQMNIITSFLDGSAVYGSSEIQALELRDQFRENGLMRFDIVGRSQKAYLPFEKDSDMDCKRNFSQENPIRCFLAGDLRANEQVGLASMHTLFLREHNRIATQLLRSNPRWNGNTVYQETRKIVSAMLQHITYAEWLPTVLGKTEFDRLIGTYTGYDASVNPSISNAFATAAFRFGHTLINPTLFRLDKNFNEVKEGHLPLHKAFFAPERLLLDGGIDPLIRGLFASPLKLPRSSQLLNTELTEKLFNRYFEVALDLAVMNIQRARDHGLPSYTAYRGFCNLSIPSSFDDMEPYMKDASVRQKLKSIYGHPANIDLWVGGITEDVLPGALMGPTFACIIAEQFKRLRDGDRFWYENDVFSTDQLAEIKKTSLSRLFCDNGDDIDRVQRNVFLYPGRSVSSFSNCNSIPSIELRPWEKNSDSTCSLNHGNRRTRKRRDFSCLVGEVRFDDGSSWDDKEDKCVRCQCKTGEVFCSVTDHCLQEL